MVFSSQRAAASAAVRCSRPGSIGTCRGSTCQYRQNLSQQTWTFAPITRFGWPCPGRRGGPAGPPAPQQGHAAQHAGLAGPGGRAAGRAGSAARCGTTDGACHRSARMLTQRRSISAVCGYSSLSIMFLLRHSVISCSACGSIQVVTNVARLSRALPSRISSSRTTCSAVSGSMPCSGSRSRVTRGRAPDVHRVDVQVPCVLGVLVLAVQGHAGLLPRARPRAGSGRTGCRPRLGRGPA